MLSLIGALGLWIVAGATLGAFLCQIRDLVFWLKH
jgi:hypothetical protein